MKRHGILQEFLKYVSLNILGQMAYSCYTLADTFFVSVDQGTNGLTSLNLAFPIFCLMNGFGLMIGMGGGTRYSLLKSRGEHESADQIFTNAVYMVLILAFCFFTLGLFASGKIVRILGADDSVFTMTNIYLKVMLLFAPAFLTNNLLQCFVRNDGNPSLSMTAMTTGCMANIILDYIFIFPCGMGIFGAILATGMSPVISILVLCPYFIKRKNQFHLTKILPGKNVLKIASSGVPPFITELSSGIVMFLFNFIILRLEGNVGVAAFGVVTVVSLVVVAMYTGLSQGIQPILSLHHGARHMREVKQIWKYAMVTMIGLSIIIYAIIYFRAAQIAGVFNSEKDLYLLELAIKGLKTYFLACPFIGFNIVTATYFISTERTLPAQVLSVLRGFIVLVPMAFLLAYLFQMTGVWIAYPATEILVAFFGTIVLFRSSKSISR